MPVQEITFDELHPVVRFAATATPHLKGFVLASDCRLFLLRAGHGSLVLLDRTIVLRENQIIYLPTGIPYQFVSEPNSRLSLCTVNFDLTHERSARQSSIPLVPYTPDRLARLTVQRVTDCPLLNEPASLPLTSTALGALNLLEQEYLCQKKYACQQMSGCMLMLLSALARQYASGAGSSSEYLQPVDLVIEYIQAHYAEPLTNESIGAALSYHPNYINRLMVAQTGQSLHHYLMNVRVHRALELIQSTAQPLSLIALSCGFKDSCHFSRCFREIMGETPSAFRTGR